MAQKRSYDEMETANPFKSLALDHHDADNAESTRDGDVTSWQTVSKKKRNREKRNIEKKVVKKAKIEAQERLKPTSISFSNHARLNSFVKMRDLQGLVLYLLADEPSPQWIAVSGRTKIHRAVVVQLAGLDADLFKGRIPLLDSDLSSTADLLPTAPAEDDDPDVVAMKDSGQSPDDFYPVKLVAEQLPVPLKPLSKVFDHWWPVRSAGEDKSQYLWSSSRSMLSSPIPKSKSSHKGNGVKAVDAKDWTGKAQDITHFIATREELTNAEYRLHPAMLGIDSEQLSTIPPLPDSTSSDEAAWANSRIKNFAKAKHNTGDKQDLSGGRHVLSIDCEMCKTSDVDFELTRISIVDWDGTVVLDELVKPPREITDYLSQYSGITKELLDPVSTTLQDIQQKLLDLVTDDTIIIGHSLNSDLNALKFTHPYVVDTAIIYPHARGPPLRNSLRYLTQRYLNREIQARQGCLGHDSIEDARAVLDLVKQKCEKGVDWGTSGMSDEPLYRRLGRTECKSSGSEEHEVNRLQTTAHVACPDAQNNYGAHASLNIACSDDDEVVRGIGQALSVERSDGTTRGHDFVWASLRSLEDVRGWRENGLVFPNSRNDIGKAINSLPQNKEPSAQEITDAVKQTVARISRIYEMLPQDTAFLIYSGAADRREWLRLQHQQQQFKREYQVKKWDELSVRWTDIEEQALRRAYRRARDGGLALITTKTE